MISIATIRALLPLPDDIIEHVTSQPTFITANKAILDIMILYKGSDSELIEFCSIMEAIITIKEKVAQVVEPLRNG